MRVGQSRQRTAHGFGFGRVHDDAGATGLCLEIEYFEGALRSADRRPKPAGICSGGEPRLRDACTRRGVEELQTPVHRLGGALGFHGARISRIDEGQPASGIARPDRRRQRLDHGPQRSSFHRELLVALKQLDDFALDPAGLFEAEHGVPAHGAALRLDRMAAQRTERHRKRFAAGAQRLHGALHDSSLAGFQPAVEYQKLLRPGQADYGGIARYAGLVGARRPIDHDLRFGQQKGISAIDLFPQSRILVACPGLNSRRASARAHQHDCGYYGK